jgi:hypothetical protein
VAFFLFGLAAGFVYMRLRSRAPRQRWESRLLPGAAWVLMSAALSFGAALLAWALIASG